LAETKRKYRKELLRLNIVPIFKLAETVTDSSPSKTLTAHDVDFLVFSGTASSTSRFFSSFFYESNPFCHPNIDFNVRLESFKSVLKIGEYHSVLAGAYSVK